MVPVSFKQFCDGAICLDLPKAHRSMPSGLGIIPRPSCSSGRSHFEHHGILNGGEDHNDLKVAIPVPTGRPVARAYIRLLGKVPQSSFEDVRGRAQGVYMLPLLIIALLQELLETLLLPEAFAPMDGVDVRALWEEPDERFDGRSREHVKNAIRKVIQVRHHAALS
jgi:hypothetical protein